MLINKLHNLLLYSNKLYKNKYKYTHYFRTNKKKYNDIMTNIDIYTHCFLDRIEDMLQFLFVILFALSLYNSL